MVTVRKLAPGLQVKSYHSKQVYHIHFMFQKKAYRRDISSDKLPVSKENDKVAKGLKSQFRLHDKRNELAEINKWLASPIKGRRNPNQLSNALKDHLDRFKKSGKEWYPVKKQIDQCLEAFVSEDSGQEESLRNYTIQELAENPGPIFERIEGWEHLTLKTVRNYLGPMRAVFNRAYIKRQIITNPFANFNPSDLIDGKQSSYQIDPYSESELLEIIAVALKWEPVWGELYPGRSLYRATPL